MHKTCHVTLALYKRFSLYYLFCVLAVFTSMFVSQTSRDSTSTSLSQYVTVVIVTPIPLSVALRHGHSLYVTVFFLFVTFVTFVT